MGEKESAAASKHALAEQREKEMAFLKEKQEVEAEGVKMAKKDAVAAQKAAEKTSAKELKDIEKMRMAREKDRQVKFREAAGLIKKSPAKRALMDGSAASP